MTINVVALAKKCGAVAGVTHVTDCSGKMLVIFPDELQAFADAVLEEAATKGAERLKWCESLFERKWNGVVGAGSEYEYHLRGDWRHMVQHLKGETFREAVDAAMKGQK